MHTIPNIHAIHTIHTLHRKHSIPIIVTILTIHTIHTVISNIPHPTDLHTILTIHTTTTIHAIHSIPTIHTKHTILSKHAIPDRPYTPYIPSIPYHTPTTPQGGEGEDLIWWQYMGPIPWGGGRGGGGRAWTKLAEDQSSGEWTWDVQICAKTFTIDRGLPTCRYPISTHTAWKYTPSQPIGDHALWPCPLRVVSNFVRHSYIYIYIYIYIYYM